MDSFIVVRGNDRVVEVTARNNGTVTEDTLRSAFLLERDVPIGLFKNNRALECRREGNDYVFELKSEWIRAEFELRWEEARRSRPVKPIEQGATKPKKQRIEPALEELPVDGDLAASVGRYALYYVRDDNYKRCAIPLTTRLAATFRHGENKSIQKGDEVVIRSWFDKKFEVSTRAVRFIEELDTIILQSDEADLCDKDIVFDSIVPRKGMHYLLGYLESEQPAVLHLARGLSLQGDSGGSCWNENGRLMGMQAEVEKVPHTKDDKGRPASPASGGRCCIVAIRDILGHIQDLLPPDSDVDWNE